MDTLGVVINSMQPNDKNVLGLRTVQSPCRSRYDAGACSGVILTAEPEYLWAMGRTPQALSTSPMRSWLQNGASEKKGDAVWQNPKRKVDRDELTDIPVPNVQCWNCVAAGNGMPSLCGATALP